MLCKSCGSTIEKGSKFCPVCGAAVEKKSKGNTSDSVNTSGDTKPENDVIYMGTAAENPPPEITPEPEIMSEPLPPPIPLEDSPAEKKHEKSRGSRKKKLPPEPPVQKADENSTDTARVGAKELTLAGTVTFIAAVFLVILSVISSVKFGISGKIIKKSTLRMTASAFLDSEYEDSTPAKFLYGQLGVEKATKEKLNYAEFREFIVNTPIMDFFSEMSSDYADYIMKGKNKPKVSENDIIAFLEENADTAENSIDYELKISDFNSMRNSLGNNNTAEKLSPEFISRKLKFNIGSLKHIFSFISVCVISALFIVLMIWIVVIVKKKGRHIIGAYGNIFFFSGITVFLAGIAISAGTAAAYVLTNKFVFYIGTFFLMPTGAFAAVTGISEIFIGIVLKKIRRSIRMKDKRNKAVELAISGKNTK